MEIQYYVPNGEPQINIRHVPTKINYMDGYNIHIKNYFIRVYNDHFIDSTTYGTTNIFLTTKEISDNNAKTLNLCNEKISNLPNLNQTFIYKYKECLHNGHIVAKKTDDDTRNKFKQLGTNVNKYLLANQELRFNNCKKYINGMKDIPHIRECLEKLTKVTLMICDCGGGGGCLTQMIIETYHMAIRYHLEKSILIKISDAMEKIIDKDNLNARKRTLKISREYKAEHYKILDSFLINSSFMEVFSDGNTSKDTVDGEIILINNVQPKH